MASPVSNLWTTDPEYIALLNYIIRKTRNVKAPMSIQQIARDFKEKSGAPQGMKCISFRIQRLRKKIHSFGHIDRKTKVRMLFALSASVEADFLKELRNEAFVKVDEKDRITHYKTNDGSFELRGDHSQSAKMKTAQHEMRRSLRSLIIDYFEKKNDEKSEMGNLIDFITEKCEIVDTPFLIQHLAIDFDYRSGMAIPLKTIQTRIKRYGREIQNIEFLDTHSKVKQLFGLSATVDPDYLEKLRKKALVEVDEKNRITHYKANDGSLELKGDHSQSAKMKTVKFESKQSLRWSINSYFERENDAGAVPETEVEKEMGNLIKFITEKCDNVTSPLTIRQLTKDYNKHFGKSASSKTIRFRIRAYCREIQKIEFLDTHTKVKQLFGLNVTLDSDYLKELQKDAVVKVDSENRITEYKSNDGSLKLKGSRCGSRKTVEKKREKNVVSMSDNSEEESDKERSNDSSDEYSSEEFDSEFDSDDGNDHLDETEDHTDLSTFHNKTPVRNRSPTESSIDTTFDFVPLTERSSRSKEIETREEEENDSIKTRSGRLSKRRHLDSDFSYNLANCSSSGAPMSTNPASSKPAKQKKIAIEKKEVASSSNQTRSSSRLIRSSSGNSSISSVPSKEDMENQKATEAEKDPSDYHGHLIQEMDDYDYNPREDNTPDSPSIDNSLQEQDPPSVDKQNTNIEAQNTHNRSDAVAPEPKPEKENLTLQNHENCNPNTNGNGVTSIETPIKVENSTEDVKPEITHNFKIKFFNAMKTLIISLNTPSLSDIQSKIHQKIRNIKRSGEMISNDEMITALELLVARIANHSVVNLSESVKSVSLIQFFCYLKASILNSKLIGVEGLVENISKRIEESQNKRIPMVKVANVLRASLDIDGF